MAKKKEVAVTLEDKMKDLFHFWINATGLAWWRINFNYTNDYTAFPEPDCVMTCDADWKYMTAYINVNLPRLELHREDGLEEMVLHELMHIFLNEMRDGDGCTPHEERVASTLARGFLWARDVHANQK
jgi:hypothetical protein